MDFFQFVLVWILIATVAGIVKDLSKTRRTPAGKEILEEVRRLREEIRQLKAQNNDVILSLDGALRQMDRRVDQLESSTFIRPAQPDPATAPLHRG